MQGEGTEREKWALQEANGLDTAEMTQPALRMPEYDKRELRRNESGP